MMMKNWWILCLDFRFIILIYKIIIVILSVLELKIKHFSCTHRWTTKFHCNFRTPGYQYCILTTLTINSFYIHHLCFPSCAVTKWRQRNSLFLVLSQLHPHKKLVARKKRAWRRSITSYGRIKMSPFL